MNMFTNMFKFNPQPAATQQPTSSSNQPTTGTPPVSDASKEAAASQNPVNPLDAYNEMYKNSASSTDISAPSFRIDPKVLGEVSNSMDFTKTINPELMQKALAGDAKSLVEMMQSVGRNAYSASLEHATALTETHLGQRTEFDRKQIDKGVRNQLTSNALSNAPNYSHPVVKAELNRVANMIAQANPDASPAQIAQAAQKQLQDIATALNGSQSGSSSGSASNEPMDWSKYLTS